MKIVVCLCLMFGAAFVRGQDEPTTASVEISTSGNLALNETEPETTEMETSANETTPTTLINETITTPTTLINETITSGSNPEILTSSDDLSTMTDVSQELVTTPSSTDFFTENSQPSLSVANFTDFGENVTEDQMTSQQPVGLETTVVTTINSTIPEGTDTTGESTRADPQASEETMVEPMGQEVVNETTTAPESVTSSLETMANVTRVAVEVTSQQSVVQTEVTHAAGLTSTTSMPVAGHNDSTPDTTASTQSTTSASPYPTCSGLFECFDLNTVALILAFAAGAAFVVIVSFVVCRKCIKGPPDGKYSLMSSSEDP